MCILRIKLNKTFNNKTYKGGAELVKSMKLKRGAKGLTQKDMADQLGVSKEYYNMIENDRKTPSVTIAKEIGKILEIDWTTFYDDNKNNG